jgi:hypothetical protein
VTNKSSNQGKTANSGQKARCNSAGQSVSQSKSGIKAQSAAKEFVDGSSFSIDPLGSYTGRSKDEGEKPVQDGDDL